MAGLCFGSRQKINSESVSPKKNLLDRKHYEDARLFIPICCGFCSRIFCLTHIDGWSLSRSDTECQPCKPVQLMALPLAAMMAMKKTSGGWDRTSDTRLMKPLL